jgi:hypothetical protein
VGAAPGREGVEVEILEGDVALAEEFAQLGGVGPLPSAARTARRAERMDAERRRFEEATGFLTFSLSRLGVYGLRKDQQQLVFPKLPSEVTSRLGTLVHAPLGPLHVFDVETCAGLMGLWRQAREGGGENGLFFTNRGLAEIMQMAWRAGKGGDERGSTNDQLEMSLNRLVDTTILARLQGPNGFDEMEARYHVLERLTRAKVKRAGTTWQPRHVKFGEPFWEHLKVGWGAELDLEVCAHLRNARSLIGRRMFILLESHRFFGETRGKRFYEKAIDEEFLAQLRVTDSNASRVVSKLKKAGELICRFCPIYADVDVEPMRSRPGAYKLRVVRQDVAKAVRESIMADHRDVRARVAASLRATQSSGPADGGGEPVDGGVEGGEPGQLAFGLPPGVPPAA